LEIQETHKVKVLRKGQMKRRRGFIIKNYKAYQVYLLSSGSILFYTPNENSKKYGKESEYLKVVFD